ncbi:MAG: DUF455 family protein [Verrucomicrobiota bacterium]
MNSASTVERSLNVTEFAERLLQSEDLSIKLSPPGKETLDFVFQAPVDVPDEPARSAELKFGRLNNMLLPARPELVNEERRGELLHFFANHELLATELMALALVKFPDAPVAFRRGLLNTLLEEQRHTKWYLARMKECGITFGDLPVNRYFWDSVAPMETPLDYVTRLSLTFEQANLDYSRHYAGVMRDVGDTKTANILEQIYKDEITHVGYGLKWFRKWKAEGESDWEAFNRGLVFPLSPSRAKGNGAPFNTEGRRKAGIDSGFVEELEFFERSRGRTPDVYFFNPFYEEEIANRGRPTQNAAAQDIEHNLEFLAAFLAKREDVTLLRQLPSRQHLAMLRENGFVLPELVELDENGGIPRDSLLKRRRLHRLRPWGLSPACAKMLEPLVPQLPDAGKDVSLWNEEWATLGAKPPVVGKANEVTKCETWEKVVAATRGGGEFVAKAPWGASGRRNLKFDDLEKAKPWVEKTIASQGWAVIEPWCDRVFDFSAHYEMEKDGLRFIGFVRMENDRRGQFRAAEAGPKFLRPIDPEIARFLMETPEGADDPRLGFFTGTFMGELEKRFTAARYLGPIGIDAFVHRQEDGSLALRPVVEINCRFTMGRIAIELAKKINPTKTARLEIVRKEEFNFEVAPASEVSGSPARLSGGRICLNDPKTARRFLAVLSVPQL